jgi:decaprenyl-phosphate phosphoribosyltransferase
VRTEPEPTRSPASAPRSSSRSRGLVRLLRPRQWVKNVLVFAAPGAAGVLTDPVDLGRTLIALVAFCLAASGTYALNDAADVEADRRHESKRHRPVAAGTVPVGVARAVGAGLLVAAVAVAATAGRWELPAVVVGYVALTTAYTIWLKHVAVIDLAAVAAGFVLRAIAGAAATGVEVSAWFLIVASFGSLFMVAGKRSAELGDGARDTRAVLAAYPPEFLLYVRAVASGVAVLAYVLWAFEEAGPATGFPWYELSIIPFVLAVLRYALRLAGGEGGAPEDIVLGDRTLQAIGLVWAVTFALGVHLA